MRFPDEDDYRWAGALKRLWYRIICPFTFGARLWMVTTSILCALAVVQSANGSWGYHGRAQDTGFLSGNFVNGVRLAWQIDAADAGLDRIDDYVARDGRLFLVGYHGTQRIAVGYDASHSTPRELWRVDVDDEPGVHWWDGDLLVGNTLISPADGKVTTGWPSSGDSLAGNAYARPTSTGWSSAPIGPIRLYCPDLSTGHCEAWDKTATHVWDFDASSDAFPDIVAPVNGWVPLMTARKWPDKTLPPVTYDLAGFLNLETGERTGVDAIEESCGPAKEEDYDGTTTCRLVHPDIFRLPIIRGRDGWIVSDGLRLSSSSPNDSNVATVAPDGSNPSVGTLSLEAMERIAFLNVHATDDSELPTTEDLLHFAATGEHTWEASSAVVHTSPGSVMASVIINDNQEIATNRQVFDDDADARTWARGIVYSRDASVALIPNAKSRGEDYYTPLLVDSAAAAADWSRPDKGEYRLKNSAVPGWRTLQVSSGTVLFDDLVVARISPETSPWYKRLLGLAPSSGDRIVGLTPAPGPMRSVR